MVRKSKCKVPYIGCMEPTYTQGGMAEYIRLAR